ncbi:YheC/YheD family protein [Halobacillus halophilus]|uniref:YheC/YheD family protein n=1 Tax=Halobacillus halophilus TaxID=1570 RepID=UPI001CD1BDCC|nr:YheC/YheD family protein [Halobacillus halophilus]MCA1011492.1 YheC/YheD family protein [Halobacillus halophilus]
MRRSRSKWKKYKLMRKEKNLSAHLPETHLLNEESFNTMIDKYGTVMIKPSRGYQGKGVIQVSCIEWEVYEFHSLYKKYLVEGKDHAFEHIRDQYCSNKPYIVQQRIPLAQINGCPYDIRVMTQRLKNSDTWVVTGTLAKVAAENFVITNYPQKIIPLEEALERSMDSRETEITRSEIERICIAIAEQIGPYYENSRTFGFDIGLDQEGKVWIIEANLKPGISMFKNLKDLSMYEKIKKYKRRRLH